MENLLGLINLMPLLALGVAWLVTVRLVFARRSSQGDDLMQRGMTIAGWVMVLLGVLGLLAMFVGPVAFVAWLIFLVIMAMAVGQYRQSERRALLWGLALAAERGIPLEQAANAFADERYDETGLRAARLARELERGTPLPDAVKQSRNLLPFDARLACGVGWQGGCLGPALRRVVEFQEEFENYVRAATEKLFYLLLVGAASLIVATFLIVRIVPSLDTTYQEFGLEMPRATLAVIELSDWADWLLQFNSPAVVPMFGSLGLDLDVADLLILVALMFCLVVILYYVGWIRWEPWLVRRIWRRAHTAWILRYLAFLTQQGRPLEFGVRLLAANYPAGYIAMRLFRATGLMSGGRDWCDALRAQGLIRTADVAALRAAQRAGNLPWVMEELSESHLRRLVLRFRAFLSIVLPISVLLCGGVLLALVMSVLLPVPTIIMGLQAAQ